MGPGGLPHRTAGAPLARPAGALACRCLVRFAGRRAPLLLARRRLHQLQARVTVGLIDGGQRGMPEGKAQRLIQSELDAERQLAAGEEERAGGGVAGLCCATEAATSINRVLRCKAAEEYGLEVTRRLACIMQKALCRGTAACTVPDLALHRWAGRPPRRC